MEERSGRGVRMRDVAGAAGVSRQAVYDHFGSRADLMVATVRHGDEVLGLDGRLRRYRAANGGAERLGAFVEFWGNYVPEIHGIARALLAARETDEAVAAAWDDRMGVVYEACRDIVDGFIGRGAGPVVFRQAADVLCPCSRSALGSPARARDCEPYVAGCKVPSASSCEDPRSVTHPLYGMYCDPAVIPSHVTRIAQHSSTDACVRLVPFGLDQKHIALSVHASQEANTLTPTPSMSDRWDDYALGVRVPKRRDTLETR